MERQQEEKEEAELAKYEQEKQDAEKAELAPAQDEGVDVLQESLKGFIAGMVAEEEGLLRFKAMSKADEEELRALAQREVELITHMPVMPE